jgi:hypothetical protein
MRKRVPTPGVLCTVISPPIRSVSILAIVRPRPVPPPSLAPAKLPRAAPRANGSKMRSMSRSAMPGPVSSISK